MAHMTLPATHTEADARLAERIGCALELEEVHVFWTLPVPEGAEADRRRPDPATRADRSAGLIGALTALGDLFERLGARLVAREQPS